MTTLLTGSLFPPLWSLNVAAIAAAMSIPLIIVELHRSIPHPAAVFAVVIFGALAVKPFLSAPMTEYGADKFFRLVTLTLLSALAACLIRNQEGLITWAKVWVLTSSGLAVATLLGGADLGGRAAAFNSSPIWVARALCDGVVIVAWLRWQRIMGRRLTFILIIGLIYAVIETGSRGPLAGLLLGVLSLAYFGRQMRWKRLASVTVLCLVGALVLLSVAGDRATRYLQLFGPSRDVSSAQRATMWTESLVVIRNHFGGVGMGNWSAYADGEFKYPHNIFLETFAELGWIIGAVLLGATILVIVRLARNSRLQSASGLALGLLVTETASAAVSGDINARSFFAFLVLGWIVSKWNANETGPFPASTSRSRRLLRSQPNKPQI